MSGYVYDAIDREIIADRAAEFRDQVARRMSGELSEEHFKPLRLMNGLYLQLHAYMLRVAIPYGVLSSRQLHGLADLSRRFDKGYGHFTTRQNVQFHWIALKDAPDALDALAAVDLHAIQTSGNCIRNTTSDPYAGAAAEEVDDPRVWSEAIRQWSTLHPEFSWLPRKFKIAVTGSRTDRTAARVHDIGLILKRDSAGTLGFEVIVGGGLGRTPHIGVTIREHLPANRLFSYLTAILRTYNRLGRRDNLYKARIKILVAETGAAAFAAAVETEWNALTPGDDHPGADDLPDEALARIRGRFGLDLFETMAHACPELDEARRGDPALARFVRNNVAAHKRPGYAIVNVSLKTPGEVPGDCSADQMDAIASLARRYSFDEIRVTHEQNLVLPHVRRRDLAVVHAELVRIGLAAPNHGLVSDIIACPGLDYCALANARAIPIAQEIALRFADPARAEAAGEFTVNISGCINACGHHHVGNIGILGVDKRGEEFYQLTLGGSADEQARVGQVLGPALAAPRVAEAVDAIVEAYLRERIVGERFLATFGRVGLGPFKEAVYAQADPA